MYHSSSPKKIDKGIYHDFISFNFSIFFWVYYNLCFFLQLETSGDQHQSGWHGQLLPEAARRGVSFTKDTPF